MADPITSNKSYAIPTHGSDVGAWDAPLNSNFTIIDKNLSTSFSQALASTTPVILSATNAQNLAYVLSGALTTNIVVAFPAVGGFYIINNVTTGAFNVTITTVVGGSTGPIIPQNAQSLIYSDGTNVYLVSSGPPVGSITIFAGSTTPSGYLLCYGQQLSTTTYATLFAAIGTQFGSGAGTFALPDLRGRVPAGVDNMGGGAAGRLTNAGFLNSANTLGNVGGLETETLTVPQLPAHRHGINLTGVGAHSHGITIYQDTITAGSGGSAAIRSPTGGTTDSQTINITGQVTDYVGSDTAHPNVQPTLLLNFIIKYQ